MSKGRWYARMAGACAVAMAAVVGPFAAKAADRFIVFSGFDATTSPDATGYIGGVAALTGDLSTNAFVIKPFFVGGAFDGTGGGRSGGYLNGSLDAGYQFFFGPVRLTPYVGVAVGRQTNNVVGVAQTKVGAQFQLDVMAKLGDQFYVSGIGQYTTSWSQVWSRGRAGFNLSPGGPAIGPEIIYGRSDLYEQIRVGGFMEAIRIVDRVTAGFDAGVSFERRNAKRTSGYVGGALGVTF